MVPSSRWKKGISTSKDETDKVYVKIVRKKYVVQIENVITNNLCSL
jgi:hypothetical protein